MAAEEAWEAAPARPLHGTPPARRDAFLEVFRERRPLRRRRRRRRPRARRGRRRRGRRSAPPGRPAVRGTAPPTPCSATTRPASRLVGDHLIAHISSNPLVHLPPDGPGRPGRRGLGAPLLPRSLAVTAAEELSVLRTGHGAEITDHRAADRGAHPAPPRDGPSRCDAALATGPAARASSASPSGPSLPSTRRSSPSARCSEPSTCSRSGAGVTSVLATARLVYEPA